ncbi:MAG: M28 family metallopeptidase [bacterium]|nr:M28 family metallopeptidase [bacterium]
MRTSVVVGIAIAAVLAACFGAAASQNSWGTPQDGTGTAGTPQNGTQESGQSPGQLRSHPAIDRRVKLPMTAIRAPKGFGERAFARAEKIVGFGPRYSAKPAGMPGWTQQLRYIETELQAAGLKVIRDTWTDRKELITFTNLRATIPGKRDDRILLACHHDTKCTIEHPDQRHNFDFVGANDGASAVALLLELVPTLLATKREATIELVFFDGEESLDWNWNEAARALFGSKRYVKRHREAQVLGEEGRISALILLDMVGGKNLHIQDELYSTTRLRQILWSAAVASGHDKHFFQRAEGAADDHVPFMEVGIPAVDLIDLNGNVTWHTPADTLENLDPRSFEITADVVLTMLPEVEKAYILER